MSLQPLLEASFAIQLHVATVIPAAVIGAIVLFSPKGTPFHRLLGRIFVILMVVTSMSTFFIHEIRLFYGFSPIHLISAWVIFGCLLSVHFARRGKITQHRRIMQGVYLGGIVVAGGFTFLPTRIMHQVAFGSGGADALTLSAVALAVVLLLFAVLRQRRRTA